MDKQDIIDNAETAVEEFNNQIEQHKVVRHHPGTSLTRELAEGAILNERLKAVQQMRFIIGTRGDIDWNDVNP